MNPNELRDPSGSDERFDRIARLAQRTFGVEAALIGFYDGDRITLTSRVGLEETSLPRPAEGDPLAPFAADFRFLVWHPLLDEDGREIGLLGLLGRSPQRLDAEQKRALRDLAGMIQDQAARPAPADAVDDEFARALARLRASPSQVAARRKTRLALVVVGVILAVATTWASSLARRLAADAETVASALAVTPPRLELTPAPLERLSYTARLFSAAVIVRSLLAVAVIASVLVLFGRYTDERMGAHALVELERARFQAIIDGIGDGIIVADARGRLTLFNPAAERMLGVGVLDAEPGLWSRLYGIYLPDGETLCPAERHPLTRAVAGETVRSAEFVVRNAHRPGGVRVVIAATPVRAADGRPAGGVAVIRDAADAA